MLKAGLEFEWHGIHGQLNCSLNYDLREQNLKPTHNVPTDSQHFPFLVEDNVGNK